VSKKQTFSKQDVLDYLELKVLNGEASQDEEDSYTYYKWDDQIEKSILMRLYREMLIHYKEDY